MHGHLPESIEIVWKNNGCHLLHEPSARYVVR